MEVDVLLHALAARPARRAGPRRAGRGRGPRRQQGPVRLAQDKGATRELGRHRQPAPGLPHHGGERPGRRIRREEVQGAPGAVNEADAPNAVARGFGGRAPRTHICSDLTCVRVGASWNCVCLLVDPCNREVVGRSAGPGEDAKPVKPAFATLSFPISGIEVLCTGTRQRVRQRRDRPDARGLRHREVAVGQGPPLRQRRRRVDQQDTEGRARPPRDARHDARTPGQTLGLRAPVRQLQDPPDAGLHVSGRVQGSGAVPPGIVQIGVANPRPAAHEVIRDVLDRHGVAE